MRGRRNIPAYKTDARDPRCLEFVPMDSAQTRVFEMLVERLGALEDSVSRVAKRMSEIDARADIRELVLTPVSELVGTNTEPDSRYYKLCERLELYMYDALDVAQRGPDFVRRAAEWLREMGANRISFPLLCQISNMTDDVVAVLNLIKNTGVVPVEDGLAFALFEEQQMRLAGSHDPDTQIALQDFILRYKHQWSNVGYRPGVYWLISRY